MTNLEIFSKIKDAGSHNHDIKVEFENEADYFVKLEVDESFLEEEIDDEYEAICNKYDWSLPNTENGDFKSVVVNVDFVDNNVKYEKEPSIKEDCCKVTDYIIINEDENDNIDRLGSNIDFKDTTIILHENEDNNERKPNFDAINHTNYAKTADEPKNNLIRKKITFQCVHCSLKYNDIQILAEHMKAIHGNIKISYQQKFANVIDGLNKDKESEKKEENKAKNLQIEKTETKLEIGEKKLKLGPESEKKEENKAKNLQIEQTETKLEIGEKKLKLGPIKIRSCKVCKKLFTYKPTSINCGSVLFCKNCLFGSDDSESDDESSDGNRHECAICSKVFSKYKTLHSHITDIHSGGLSICDYCGQKFKCKRYLLNHMRKVHSEHRFVKGKAQEFKCLECPNIYNNKVSLRSHIKNCHGLSSKCEICGAIFKSKPYLNTHMYRVHCHDSSKYFCLICGKNYRSTRRVRIHMKNSHPYHKLGKRYNLNKKTEECFKCKGMFSKSFIKKHLELCSGNTVVSVEESDTNVIVL